MTTIESSAQGVRDGFPPLMELMSSKVDELESDIATLMSTHGNPPGMGRDVPQHHIGSPLPGTPPTNSFDSQWSPPNPGSTRFQGDPWSRPHAENPPDANYGGWQAP